MKEMKRFFRTPALSQIKEELLLAEMKKINPGIMELITEWCFYVETDRPLRSEELSILNWLLSETFEPKQFGLSSLLQKQDKTIEVGPRQGLVTPWNSGAVAICQACGLGVVTRLERARRYALNLVPGAELSIEQQRAISRLLYDRMTEQVYTEPLRSFESGHVAESVKTITLLERGKDALIEYAKANDFAWSELMIDYICDYFINKAKRNPTDVELFMFGQLNSEHCRHHKFNGKYVIDGQLQPQTLFEMIKSTFSGNYGPIATAFSDNAAIMIPITTIGFMPQNPLSSSAFVKRPMRYCLVFKVETHNHPTAISPYQGAATGVAVRRDIFGSGRGGVSTFHVAGYYVGNLFIPGYELPWEKELAPHPNRLATPLKIIIEASNGASDNANCFGNPVTMGTFRSYDGKVKDAHYGWTKCAMVAGSGGYLDGGHIKKQEPKKGMLMVQIGGPAFRIGLGGGSGSSRDAGDSKEDLDFNSVQRDDPVMEQRNFNVIRACSEMGEKNPIRNTTDLGAGGYCVACGELAFPSGVRGEIRNLPCGDTTMPTFVFWCNEAQERMAILIWPDRFEEFKKICERNRCPVYLFGEITGDGQFVLTDKAAAIELGVEQGKPIDLGMNFMLADLPQITVEDKTEQVELEPLDLPDKSLAEFLELVLHLPDVGSKGFLTRKGDRSVGGKIAQQQTVGPLQLTLADNMVIAASFFKLAGNALSIGEQPIKGLIQAEAGARMSLGESLLNLASAKVDGLKSVSLSATWQWPCGQPGEDVRLFQAVKALTELCKKIGVRIAVGKDSVSMTAKTNKDGKSHSIKAPGTVQVMSFAPCPNITKKVTPDIKAPGKSKLMYLDLSGGKQRLGASALARVTSQLGNEAPDVDDPALLSKGFDAIQLLVERGLILAEHDRSDGGLITCLLEMAFAGNCGLALNFSGRYVACDDLIRFLFNEELGSVIEYLPKNEAAIRAILRRHGLSGNFHIIGKTITNRAIQIVHYSILALNASMEVLRQSWSETSFQLDALQANPEVVKAERKNTFNRGNPKYNLSFEPKPTSKSILNRKSKPVAAVLREVGTNGDREMAAALYFAGFEVLDITMTDLLTGRASLKKVHMTADPGGFSFGDVMDSGKGEAGVTRFNQKVADEIANFLSRKNTCGLGVCNGCQYVTLGSMVPWQGIASADQPRFICNTSDIFESRMVGVCILPSKSIFLQGMEGSTLPVWVAHHEGRFHSPNKSILIEILAKKLAPIRFVDDAGKITTDYPFNPNGSTDGITGISTPDGRFLAMMPHPERTFLKWQMPYLPPKWRGLKAAPWLRLFQNAREWCDQS